MHFTPYHTKFLAHELSRRYPADSVERLAGTLVDAQVDLNPHQVDAALFAFRSPLSKGVILADEVGPSAVVTFRVPVAVTGATTMQVTPQVTVQVGTEPGPSLSQACPKSVPSGEAAKILSAAQAPADLQMLMTEVGHTNRTRFRNAFMRPLIEAGLMELTVPDKPRSSKQRYRLTAKGKAIMGMYV